MSLAKKYGYEDDCIIEFKGEYECFSNFYYEPVTYYGVTYRNNEAAFQAQKNHDKNYRLKLSTMTASESKRQGRRVKLRHDWDEVKYEIMHDLIKLKFSNNEGLKQTLLDTGNRQIVEGTWHNDRIWGIDLSTGIGTNWLGEILEKVREELR